MRHVKLQLDSGLYVHRRFAGSSPLRDQIRTESRDGVYESGQCTATPLLRHTCHISPACERCVSSPNCVTANVRFILEPTSTQRHTRRFAGTLQPFYSAVWSSFLFQAHCNEGGSVQLTWDCHYRCCCPGFPRLYGVAKQLAHAGLPPLRMAQGSALGCLGLGHI